MTEPAASRGFDLNQPSIVAILYLAGFVTGITGLVGVVLAHIWVRENSVDDWSASHFQYLITTFWGAVVASLVAFALTLLWIGILLFIPISVWVGVRSVLSLVNAQRREPMPRPATLWF